MRALARLTLFAGALAVFPATAGAEPVAASGYEIEIVHLEGAAFSGLAEEPDALVVTNLADGRLYRFAGGRFDAFGPEFPHGIDVIGDPTGPYRVVALGVTYLIAQGWTPATDAEGPYDHALVELREDGALHVVSNDFWNPFDIVVDEDTYTVIDAAKNSVEQINADGSGKFTLFTFPRLKQSGSAMQNLSPTEFSAAKPYEVDAVPTGIAEHDGLLFVSLFGGFPYVEHGGAVVSLDPSGTMQVEVDELDTPVDIAFDRNGALLVLEHGRFDQASGFLPGSGTLFSINLKTAERRTIVEGLTRPASFMIRDDGTLAIAGLDGTLTFLTPGK